MDNRPLIVREGLYHDVDPADVVLRNQDVLRGASNIAAGLTFDIAAGLTFDRATVYKEAEQYITSDGTGPHPLEEENQKLKRVIASLWHRYVNDDVDGFTQLVKETLGELP